VEQGTNVGNTVSEQTTHMQPAVSN